ncbi:MAG: ABC transporter permease [Bdellovibrionales bacterium]|nr:ABC transporter permease [Bdellovibrionales bacterium]
MILRQVYFTGIQAFRLVAIAALIFGIVAVAQSGGQLRRLGGSDVLGGILVATFIRELGPMLTLVVVVARSVSAVASELSAMKSNGEIDGLRATGVSPLSYLVVSRVVSGAVSTLLLAMHFVWIAMAVGFVTAQLFIDMPWDRYIMGVTSSLAPIDLFIFFTKTFVLGLFVFFLACFCGLRTSGASFEIPQATTKAVVWSFMFCFGAQLLISGIYYFFAFERLGLAGVL